MARQRLKARKDGRYQTSATWKGERVFFYGKTQANALKAKKDFLDGKTPKPSRLTVETFMKDWLEDVARPGLRPGSYRQYESLLRCRILPAFGGMKLQEVTGPAIQKFCNGLTKARLAPRTVRAVHKVLHSALGYAVEQGLLTQNPAAKIRLPVIEDVHGKAMKPAEVKAFIAACEGAPYGDFFLTMLTLGTRPGELRALKWAQVDWQDGLVLIVSTLTRHSGTWQVSPPKTKASVRAIPMTPQTIEALQRQRDMQEEQRERAGTPWREFGFVFTTALGGPLDQSRLRRAFVSICEDAGLKDRGYTPHALRHSYGTALALAGVDVKARMALMGHVTISQALAYTTVVDQQVREAAARLGVVLGGSSSG